jgi:MFS family permease
VDTPLWAGIYLLPLTVGFLVAGPVSGYLSDRFGTRLFAAGGLIVTGLTFLGLVLLPVDFPYWVFALLVALNGLGSGLFSSPNASAVMGSVPAEARGSAAGMRGTFMNSGSALSIGVFFSLMIVGLAAKLPAALTSGLEQQGVPAPAAHAAGQLPPVGSLFAAFLGYNPIKTLLGDQISSLPAASQAKLTGKEFFPHLIAGPFHAGLVVVFVAAALMMLVAAVASLLGDRPASSTGGTTETHADANPAADGTREALAS